MESILEELNEGVVIVDDQLRVVFANETLIRMGQYKRGGIEGHTPDAIFPVTDIPYLMRQQESGHRYGHSRSEFYLLRKNGEKIPAIFSGRVIAPGTVVHLAGKHAFIEVPHCTVFTSRFRTVKMNGQPQ